MRARAVVASVAASAGVLVVGWQLGQAAHGGELSSVQTTPDAPAAVTQPDAAATGTSPSATPTPTDAVTAPAQSTGGGLADGSYTGDDVQTAWGGVQVTATVSGGRLTDVTAVHLTGEDGNFRSQRISNYAAPILRQEALQAQSARVQVVGGATYTSEGYLQSLQSALDQATK